jgi:uncharacterized Zn finger protein
MKRTPLKKKAKSHSEGWWRDRADRLLQDILRKKAEKCEVCGGKNEVAHHVFTKQSSSYLRYDLRNLVHLCHKCHFNHHIKDDPNIIRVLITNRGQAWIDELERDRRKTIKTGKFYYQQKCEEYEKLWKQIATS